MEVSGTLLVDGYIKANSYDTTSTIYNGASGGSGGSIFIHAGNFTGKFCYDLLQCVMLPHQLLQLVQMEKVEAVYTKPFPPCL